MQALLLNCRFLILPCFLILTFTLLGGLPDGQAQALTQPSLANVTYCTTDGVDLKMDVYFPKASLTANPAVVYVHGGGWTSGDKKGGAGALGLSELLSRGYVVVSLNYRLAPQFKFPAQIEDVKCAIRSLRANSVRYRIDPSRIGAWGASAGGQLVSLLGVTDPSAGFDVGQYLDQSSRVQAVVDFFGPTNLTSPDFATGTRQILQNVFGSREELMSGSPVTYVSSDDPPFLIVQGTLDSTVPPHQSQEFYDKLTKAGVPATLVMVQNAGHGFVPVGAPISPTIQEINKLTADFFDKELKNTSSVSTQTTAFSSGFRWQPPILAAAVISVMAIAIALAIVATFAFRKRQEESGAHLKASRQL
jgi:acetyl esterase/lipase